MNIFKAQSSNKTTGLIFYVFEICAAAIFFVMFVLSIIYAVQMSSFAVFIETILTAIFNSLVLFGLGKVIDLLDAKKQ